jgi:hypothetical protein
LAGQKPDYAAGPEQLLVNHFLQELVGVVEQLFGFDAHHRVVENLGVLALELPGLEKGRPVDEPGNFGQVVVFEVAVAQEGRLVDLRGFPVDGRAFFAGLFEGHVVLVLLPRGVVDAQGFVFLLDLGVEILAVSRPSSDEATGTLRLASSTCTTGPE